MKTATEIKRFDHAEWIDKLKSYKNEIASLEGTLSHLVAVSRKPEVLARAEHFQNQFIVQKSNVNDILHAVKMDQKEAYFELITKPNSQSRTLAEDRSKDLAETFEKTMSELKNEFGAFMTKERPR